jgi:hypothetical protein
LASASCMAFMPSSLVAVGSAPAAISSVTDRSCRCSAADKSAVEPCSTIHRDFSVSYAEVGNYTTLV